MSTLTGIRNATRSETVRLRRMWKLLALAAALGVLGTIFAFSGSGVGPGGRSNESSGATETVAALAAPDGIVAGLGTASTIAGLIALVLWALSLARDLQTGTIRVLLVTQARRDVYLAGKLLALAGATIVMSVLVVASGVGSAYLGAAANDVSTAGWAWSEAGNAVLDVSVGTLGWGALGAALAVLTRSAAAAIGGGIGFLLLGENLLASVWSTAGEWLPGGSIENVFAGGSSDVTYLHSAVLVVAYIAVAIAASALVTVRRDVVD
ncbi:MAG: ABC transporter permease subunit [Gaiella sp.]